jgi:hypothetical protein
LVCVHLWTRRLPLLLLHYLLLLLSLIAGWWVGGSLLLIGPGHLYATHCYTGLFLLC